MKCKFCRAEMGEGITQCPFCGMENSAPEKKEKVKTPLWASICIGVLAVAVLILGTVTIMQLMPEKISFKSYTGTEDKLIAQRETVVATAGDQTLTNAELQIYYWVYIYTFLDENYYNLSSLGVDLTKDFAKQECSVKKGSSWQQYFLENAIEAWHQYAVMVKAGNDAGHKLSDDEQKYLDDFRANIDQDALDYGYTNATEMVHDEMGIGASLDAYISYTVETFQGMGYYNYLCESLELTEEEIAAFYEENKEFFESYNIKKDDTDFAWVGVRHVLLQPEGTTGEDGKITYTDADWEACKVKAEAMLEAFRAGAATEEVFAALAKEYSVDSGSKENGGLYSQFFRNEMTKEFENWSFDKTRKYGDTGVIKTDYGYHLMFFIEGEAQWHYYSDAELRVEKGQNILKDLQEANPYTVDYDKIVLSHINLAG